MKSRQKHLLVRRAALAVMPYMAKAMRRFLGGNVSAKVACANRLKTAAAGCRPNPSSLAHRRPETSSRDPIEIYTMPTVECRATVLRDRESLDAEVALRSWNTANMTHDAAVLKAREIASHVLAPSARENDKAGRFSTEAVELLGESGLLGLLLSANFGGSGLGARSFAAITAALAEEDASVAMVYLMHILGTAVMSTARPSAATAVTPILQEIGAGRHLSTLAFSEAGSRSHFWAPVSRAHRNGNEVRISAKKSFVTSAGHVQSYVISALAPEGAGPTDSTLYLVASETRGLSVAGPWDGLGLRANASAPVALDDCGIPYDFQLTDDGAGLPAMLNVVLPLFCLGTAAVALGLCRAAVAGTASHLKSAKFEHLGQSLGESLPTLRAQLAVMQIDTDGLSARIDDLVEHLQNPSETTMLRVMETKAAAGEVAISVTSAAMRVCGGAAFSKHLSIERLFRDAHAGAVMAPTGDVLREFIGKALLGMPLF